MPGTTRVSLFPSTRYLDGTTAPGLSSSVAIRPEDEHRSDATFRCLDGRMLFRLSEGKL